MSQISELEENLKRGILEMLILQMLSQEDMYGYQMIAEMNERGKGLIPIKEGSLYGPLYRLIDRQCISENKVLVGKRRTRVYYHIEPAGLEFLNMAKNVYANLTEGVALILHDRKEGNQNEQDAEKRS